MKIQIINEINKMRIFGKENSKKRGTYRVALHTNPR